MAVSKRLRYEILRRDEFKCRYCHATDIKLVVDHVTPIALGGTDAPSNLVAACDGCNSGKTSSSPDAHLIGSASDDQLRWSLAMKQAAELAATKRGEMDNYRSVFHKAWHAWSYGPEHKHFELPDDWTITMDRFHNAGLPAFMWDDIVTATMTTKRAVKEPFNYVCGIGWNKVTELQDAARTLVATAKPVVEEDEEGETSLASELLPLIGEQRYERAIADERENWEDEDRSPEELQHGAVVMAVWAMTMEMDLLERAVKQLLSIQPATEVKSAQDAANAAEREWLRPGEEILGTRLAAATIRHFMDAKADEAVALMSVEELAAWLECADGVYRNDRRNSPWGGPTDRELRLRAGELALSIKAGWRYASMCLVAAEDAPTCHRLAVASVGIEGCAECGRDPFAADVGLRVCQSHLDAAKNGDLSDGAGHSLVVADFTEVAVS